jgi:putative ABC transport system permease protein
MFRNYLRVAITNLWRNKVNSTINVAGLAIGIAACTIILLYVDKELSYDAYHDRVDDLYRVAIWKDTDGLNRGNASVPYPTADVLLAEYPDVEHAGRIVNMFQQDPVVRVGDELFIEKEFYFVDQAILDIFIVRFLKGDRVTALVQPNCIVLTQSTAMKYFGTIDVVGRTVTANMNETNVDFKITGVVRDCPENSHFQYEVLAPLDNYLGIVVPFFRERIKSWFMLAFWTYVKLAPDTNPVELEAKLTQIVEGNFAPTRQDSKYFLQPMRDIHLHSNIDGELGPNNDIAYVYLFAAIALSILLMACINFINLTTAKSVDRAKEVGLRKVVGAQRFQLVRQFLFESGLTTCLAVVSALGLIELFRQVLGDFTGVSIEVNYLEPRFVTGTMLLAGMVGLASGLYPAFFLSGFQPIKTLKGVFGRSRGGKRFRSMLAVVQTAITVVLLVGIVGITQQLDYIRGKQLGFAKDQMLLINLRGTTLMNGQTYDSFKKRLLQLL